MKKIRRITAALLAGICLLTAGCEKSSNSATDDPADESTVPAETMTITQPTEADLADISLNSLRKTMIGTPQTFAVAYFGYHETLDSDLPVDPYAVIQENAPWLWAGLPFLGEIPADRIVGEAGDLFCIVPLDENAAVTVSRGCWDEENEQYIYDDMIYSSSTGDPILLFCNNAGWEPDTQLYLSGPSGEVFWYPRPDDNGCAMPLRSDDWEPLFYDFSPYREMLMADYRRMKENIEWDGVLPTEEMLTGKSWMWSGYLLDGREAYYSLTFYEDYLTVRWNDGIDPIDHEYLYAPWELTYEEGYAVLSVDFKEFAGILRYNLLYGQFYGDLYVAMDVLQEDMPIGWEPLSRFLMPPVTPDPTDMAGTWERIWTEVEGDRNESEPGMHAIEITTNYEGLYWISYTNNEFPDQSYDQKELVVFPFALYPECGNDQWYAVVNYTGDFGTEHRMTLLPEGTLVVQNYWEMDGAPMVGYEYFRRPVE